VEFADPARLSGLGVNRLIRFAAVRDIQLCQPVAERLVAALGRGESRPSRAMVARIGADPPRHLARGC